MIIFESLSPGFLGNKFSAPLKTRKMSTFVIIDSAYRIDSEQEKRVAKVIIISVGLFPLRAVPGPEDGRPKRRAQPAESGGLTGIANCSASRQRKADISRNAWRITLDVVGRIEARRNPTDALPPHDDIRQNMPAAILAYASCYDAQTVWKAFIRYRR